MKTSKQLELKPNTLYSGDCLEVMQLWKDDCIDLIYLDPPFNSKRNYNVLFGKDKKGRNLDELAQFTAFGDTWHYTNDAHARVEQLLKNLHHPAHKTIDGLHRIIPESPMLAYISYMAERVAEMHRILKESGSLYLHCDPTASHYIKIVLDEIFESKNFRNEIVWRKFAGRKSNAKVKFPTQQDCIFFYAKSSSAFFCPQYMPMTDKEIEKKYTHVDKRGRLYRLAWGRNYQTKGEQRKIYLDSQPGRMVGSLWVEDGLQLNTSSSERLGYDTQKPVALLERIVAASSKKGDLVLDPFCGCGTTAHAAQNLNRKFVGIDISIYALDKICRSRLKDVKNLKIMGLPTSFAAAAEMDPFLFEQWVVTLLRGFMPNNKQTGDGGVDGRAALLHEPAGEKGWVFAQVKQGTPTPDSQRALLSQIIGGKASMGVFITLKKLNTKTMQQTTRDAGTYQLGGTKKYPRLVYWSVEEYFDGIMPDLPDMMPTREEELQSDLLATPEGVPIKKK